MNVARPRRFVELDPIELERGDRVRALRAVRLEPAEYGPTCTRAPIVAGPTFCHSCGRRMRWTAEIAGFWVLCGGYTEGCAEALTKRIENHGKGAAFLLRKMASNKRRPV